MPAHTPFSFTLPAARIAQRPIVPYDRARLLVVNRAMHALEESSFFLLAQRLSPRDLLVFNNTRVIPARLLGRVRQTGTAAQLLLLREEKAPGCWICTGRPLRRFRPGVELEFGEKLRAEIMERLGPHEVRVLFHGGNGAEPVRELIFMQGFMPIPPYVRKGMADQEDRRDYQTIFAEIEGSIAAPTASLHFTPRLVAEIKKAGCQIAFITLHIGAASIRPLWRADGSFEPPAAERYVIDRQVLAKSTEVKQAGGRVVAVGTTVARALESMNRVEEGEMPARAETALFIEPGFEFKVVDALITNLHQPATTHLLLVEAFMQGRALLADAYNYALKHDFRFLSYGDGMLIV